MRCPIEAGNDAEMLVALAAGRLTTAEQEAFELHMAGCAECRRRAEAQRSVWGALDAWTPPDVTAGFDSRLFARIAAEERLPWWRRGWSLSWKPMLPVGAACVALMGVFLIHDPWSPAGAPAVPAAIVQTQEDAQKVDVDQVERTLDDMDMLNQLDTPASPPRAPAGS
jgi:anti-sigma factor RsiW